MRKITVLMMAAVVVGVAGGASAQTPFPNPVLPVDFCAMTDGIVSYVLEPPAGTGELSWLAALLGDDAAILTEIACATADINGEEMGGPNGVLDAYELGVVAELINNGAAYASLGAWTGQVQAQFITNYQSLYTSEMHQLVTILLPALWPVLQSQFEPGVIPNLTPAVQGAINALFPDLMRLLAGFGCINDANTNAAIVEIADLLALCDAISEGTCLINDIAVENVQGWPEYLAKDGTIPGSAVNNLQIYNNVLGCGNGVPEYVAAVLDPTEDGSCGLPDPVVVITGSSSVNLGATITLNAVVQNAVPQSYQWEKEGEGEIQDATGASYVKADAQEDDAGRYRCVVETDRGTVTSAWRQVSVRTGSEVPVAGGFGLALLAAACGMGGAVLIRRKK